MEKEIGIVVDDREVRSGIMDLLRAIDGLSVQVRHLSLGDYIVDDRLVVERKTLLDLTESIKDGRLFRQASKLAETPLRSLVVLEGTNRSLDAGRMSRESIQGALVALTVYYGIPLLRSRNPQETVRLMIYTANQGRTLAAGKLARKGTRPRGKLKTQLYILQGLPCVGPERAHSPLKDFGSVQDMLMAGEEDLTAVEGIGATTAERIRWAAR